MAYDPDTIRGYFDTNVEKEWIRFDDPRGRVALHIHNHYLRQSIEPDMHVLEAGSGPGRFTAEMARLGARITVADISRAMLDENRNHLNGVGLEHAVVAREQLDITDLSRFPDDSFDATVCYGGPLSYVMDRGELALGELVRVTRPGGPLLLSVMSNVGNLRIFLASAFEIAERLGTDRVDQVLEDGLLTEEVQQSEHVLKMYHAEELRSLLERAGCAVEVLSATNFLSAGNGEELTDLDEASWEAFLRWELFSCRQPGALDGGTHILAVARRPA